MTLVSVCSLQSCRADCSQARALWSHYDDSASAVFIQERQMQHVMLLSVFSCIGRLCSGIGSDLIVKKLHASRHWCIFLSAMIFCVAQICGATIGNPHLLGFVSGINGRKQLRSTCQRCSSPICSGLRVSLRCLSIACCPNVRYQRSVPELGFHDSSPNCLW